MNYRIYMTAKDLAGYFKLKNASTAQNLIYREGLEPVGKIDNGNGRAKVYIYDVTDVVQNSRNRLVKYKPSEACKLAIIELYLLRFTITKISEALRLRCSEVKAVVDKWLQDGQVLTIQSKL